MSVDIETASIDSAVNVRPMRAEDVEAADRVMRLAFGTIRGLSDPNAAFGDADSVRTRYRAEPECAWCADIDGEVVGSVLAARWGSFGFLGPLTVRPDLWDRGIGSRLLESVLEAFECWAVRQAGLFTFAHSPKHLGLYQKHGFWPGGLTVVAVRATGTAAPRSYARGSDAIVGGQDTDLEEMRRLTDAVFPGLDLGREAAAVVEQGIGDTLLLGGDAGLDAMAVCHSGAGSEAGSDTCYVKFAAARPGDGAGARFERLLDACETYAAESGSGRIVAGVDTGRLDAYRRLLARGFQAQRIGLSMWLHPEAPRFDRPSDYVIDDLR